MIPVPKKNVVRTCTRNRIGGVTEVAILKGLEIKKQKPPPGRRQERAEVLMHEAVREGPVVTMAVTIVVVILNRTGVVTVHRPGVAATKEATVSVGSIVVDLHRPTEMLIDGGALEIFPVICDRGILIEIGSTVLSDLGLGTGSGVMKIDPETWSELRKATAVGEMQIRLAIGSVAQATRSAENQVTGIATHGEAAPVGENNLIAEMVLAQSNRSCRDERWACKWKL
ncbi:MAG: hypothetical protein OSA89_10385 [Mariniblastus sp.]|nr:hypothetical protein [Mariniblastus sp.]